MPALAKQKRKRALRRNARFVPGEEFLTFKQRDSERAKSKVRLLRMGHRKKEKIYKLGIFNPDVPYSPGNSMTVNNAENVHFAGETPSSFLSATQMGSGIQK